MQKLIIVIALAVVPMGAGAQENKRVNPVIKDYGGIFEIPTAVEKPDPALPYKIVIEVERESETPGDVNWALNNVARLLNLHAVGGVPPEKIEVILAIHGGATYTVMNNDAYKAKYKMDNPNLKLYKELQDAGVKMFVCGQSLVMRNVDGTRMVEEVKPSISMLTILTTYQLKGYAVLKF